MRGNQLWSKTIPAVLGGTLSFNAAGELEGIAATVGAGSAAGRAGVGVGVGAATAHVTETSGNASKWKMVFGIERGDRRRCVVTDSDMQGPWHIRFKQVAGGYSGQPYQSSTFVSKGSEYSVNNLLEAAGTGQKGTGQKGNRQTHHSIHRQRSVQCDSCDS